MKEITADTKLIAACGLYCGACRSYIPGKCPGCKKNEKASWCKVRKCCLENNYLSCADCKKMSNTDECKKLNNFVSKLFSVVYRSNRNACIKKIKQLGNQAFADEMSKNRTMSVKKS